MVEKINEFLNLSSNWVNAISLIISGVTLITMLQFNRRLRKALEQKDFSREKSKILKQLTGYSDSLLDGIYDETFLNKIDLCLTEIAESYTFFSKKLLLHIRMASFLINWSCKKEIANNEDKSRYKLSKQLRQILVLIRKE